MHFNFPIFNPFFEWWVYVRGYLSGRYLSAGICPGGICPGGICPGGICPGGICPGGICPVGICPAGICPGGICPVGICPGGICPMGICPDTPFNMFIEYDKEELKIINFYFLIVYRNFMYETCLRGICNTVTLV